MIKSINANQLILIEHINGFILSDIVDNRYRLKYSKEWVDVFFHKIKSRGTYNEHEGKILMEIRNSYISELEMKYNNDSR